MAQQNIALNKPTLASSYVKPYESARAVNGTYGVMTQTSRWLCNTLPGWLMVDLGVNGSNNYWINRWVVRHMTCAGWWSPDYNMCDFKLQGSNDRNTWDDIDSVVGNNKDFTDRTLLTAVGYRYVRLYVTKGLKCNTRMASAMEFEVYQSPPLIPYLISGTGLTVSSGALSPAFVNNVFNYTTPNVENSVTSVAVKPTAIDSKAIIQVNGVGVKSGDSTNVALNVGSNAIAVKVTAADGLTTNTYTVTIVRNAVAYLTGLTITPGTLNETFSSSTLVYTSNVANSVASITVTPTTDISGAQIKVKGVAIASGTASGAIPLNVGSSNIIDVVVTNGTVTKTYTLTVTRASSAYLTNLVINNGMLNSTFAKTTLNYNATIGYDVSDFNVTPTAEDSNATITVDSKTVASGQPSQNFTLKVGNNISIPVNVTSADGKEQKSYSVVVTKPDGPYLTNIVITSVMLGFNSKVFRYTKSVNSTITFVKVTPTIADVNSSIFLNGSLITSGQQSAAINLNSGSNTLTVQVKSSAGIVMGTYIVTINKP